MRTRGFFMAARAGTFAWTTHIASARTMTMVRRMPRPIILLSDERASRLHTAWDRWMVRARAVSYSSPSVRNERGAMSTRGVRIIDLSVPLMNHSLYEVVPPSIQYFDHAAAARRQFRANQIRPEDFGAGGGFADEIV